MNTEQYSRLGQQVDALIDDMELATAHDDASADRIIGTEVRMLVKLHRSLA